MYLSMNGKCIAVYAAGLILANLQLENAVASDGNGSAIMVYGGDGSSASGDFCTFVNNRNTAASKRFNPDGGGGDGGGDGVSVASAGGGAGTAAAAAAGPAGPPIPAGGYGYGGAVYGGEHTLLGFDNSYFANNTASDGGAVACYGCQLAVGTTTFESNTGTAAGGAVYIDGGNASLSLSSSNLIRNIAGKRAPALAYVDVRSLTRVQFFYYY